MSAFDSDYLKKAAARSPAWKRDRMEASVRVFEGLTEPTGVEEDWRYVEFDTPFDSLVPVETVPEALPVGPFATAMGENSGRVQIVDGFVVSIDSREAHATRFSDHEHSPLSELVAVDHNKLSAAHASFSTDGLVIDVPAGLEMTSPLIVEIQSVIPGAATFPHVVVRVGENAEGKVMVLYRSSSGSRLLMIPEIDLQVADSGRLRYLAVQNLDKEATIVVHQRASVGRDGTSRLGEVGLGAHLGRLDLGVHLVGDGASSEVVGVYFGEGQQTLDYRMVITHQAKRTSSDVFLKGAVEDDAQSVFTGLLRIEKGAERTSTFETNRNLVLSENAKAHSVPNLEILCDDVICGHASSVGPLEEDHLYYLQSRGLRKERAERLLIRGFFQEVIDRLPIEGIETQVSEEIFSRFVAAQEEGRVS